MQTITVKATINAPVETVWKCYTTPSDIMQWNAASHDWHTTKAENDLRIGGTFTYRMEAKDGSAGFDFEGTYDDVKQQEFIAYTMPDGRKATVLFTSDNDQTHVTVTFDAESENSLDLQRQGWQAILDNFKTYAERNAK